MATPSIAAQVATLQKMTLAQLRKEWERVFGDPTQQRDRQYLWRRLARKLQEDQLPAGEPLPEKPRPQKVRTRPANGRRVPPPGSMLTRTYKGQEIAVCVLDRGFEYDGQVYRSLSAIAREVTGTSWNGYVFFRLDKRG